MQSLDQVSATEKCKTLIFGDSGAGKCLGKGTPVLLFSGETIPVEEVEVDDLLMGPDSKPRRVLSVNSGSSEMFRIVPNKGEPWTCNDVHVLTHWNYNRETLQDIALDKIIAQFGLSPVGISLQRVAVDFQNSEWKSLLTPYEVGVWLGDGHTRTPCVTKNDPEIRECWKNAAERLGMTYSESQDPRTNVWTAKAFNPSRKTNTVFQELLKFKNEAGIKSVPFWAQTASRQERLELLAGWIDTDGYHHNGGFEWTSKYQHLADAFCFIARSVGLGVTRTIKVVNDYGYQRVQVSGDCTIIPTRIERKKASARIMNKDPLRTGFAIEPIGVDDYFGFTLEGDGRFLLGDFTITHNTVFAVASTPSPSFVFDFDNKVASAARFLKFKGNEAKIKEIQVEVLSTNRITEKPYLKFKARLAELEKQAAGPNFPYKTVVLDSLTLMSDALMQWVLDSNPGTKRFIPNVPVMQDYGVATPEMKTTLGRLLSLPCHIIVVAHIKAETNEQTGEVKYKPLLSGQLADYAPKIFKEVYFAHTKKVNNVIEYLAQTRNDGRYECRTEYPALPAVVPLDFEKIKELQGK